jgi:L-lactate dehydrogenase complex protein LldG
VTDKAEFLAALRGAAAGGERITRRPFADVPVPPPVAPRRRDTEATLRESWSRAFTLLGGHVHDATRDGVADAVAGALDGRGPVLVDDASAGFGADQAGGRLLRWPACGLDVAATATCGVVRATAAIAATGSIVVDSSRAGRLVSLLPPVAVFVIDVASIVELTGDVLRRHPAWWPDGPPTNVVLVTGPSRSGDIEMILAVGVHGPGEVHAVLVDDA